MMTSWSIDRPVRSQSSKSTPAQRREQAEIRAMNRSAVNDHPGHLAGGDHLAVGGVPRGDGEAVQPPVDVRRRGGHLDLGADRAGGEVLELDAGADAGLARRARADSIAAQVAASHQASSRGVPSTGRLPEPTASAVSSSVTVNAAWRWLIAQLQPEGQQLDAGQRLPVPLGAAAEAEPLVEPVRARPSAGCSRAPPPTRALLAEPVDARAARAPRRRPGPGRAAPPRASGTRPRRRSRSRATASRRGTASPCPSTSRSSGATATQSSASRSRASALRSRSA